MSYTISCCTTVDLSREHLDRINIRAVPFHFDLDGKTYLDDFGATVSMPEFYRAMEDGGETKTSQVNIAEYCTHFEKMLQEGSDVLHVTFSSGLSGTYNSALIAADMMREKYPDRKIVIIDSLAASSGYGLLVDKAAELRDKGMAIDELARWIEENRLSLQHWFFSTNLKYYVRGGRVSKASGFIGGILSICPLLRVNAGGQLVPVEKVRTKHKVMEAIVKKMTLCSDENTEKEKCFICHSDCAEDASTVAEMVAKAFQGLKEKIRIFNVGPTVGSHTGPGTVALFFWGKKRTC